MNLKKVTFLLMALSLVFTAAAPAGSVLAQANSPSGALTTLISTYVSTPPVLDGNLNFGEWNLANAITFPHGTISAVNDSNRLYVLIDVTGSSTRAPDPNDWFDLTYDTNRNGVIDPNVDLNYGLISGGNMRYSYYLRSAEFTFPQANTYSARASGFGCFWADGSFGLTSFFPLRFTCSRHRVWEVAIDLAEINSTAGGTAKMGVSVGGTSPAFRDDTPNPFDTDAAFTQLITVNLGASPYFTLAPFPNVQVAFQTSGQQPIEVTQAVQRPDDSLPLVAQKATVARVYTITGNSPFSETARTYLYGSVGGSDLPGSPMLVSQRAPTVINRNNLNDTANFSLPQSWAGAGSIVFTAQAVGQRNDKASTVPKTIAFNTRGSLTVWIVPVNTGSVGSPVLPPQSEIDRQESYMRTIYPLAHITFVQKSWNVLGVVTGEPITALNTYYNNVVFAWIISIIFPPFIPPYTLPDQIYGLVVTSVCSSLHVSRYPNLRMSLRPVKISKSCIR
jgi:hypothetical protein